MSLLEISSRTFPLICCTCLTIRPGLPQAKTEGVLQIGKIRMRFALIRICLRAAPSVTACAVPPSSERKALVFTRNPTCLSGRAENPERFFCSYAQSKLVSPFGRDVAQRQRGQAPSLRELDLPQAKTEGAAG